MLSGVSWPHSQRDLLDRYIRCYMDLERRRVLLSRASFQCCVFTVWWWWQLTTQLQQALRDCHKEFLISLVKWDGSSTVDILVLCIINQECFADIDFAAMFCCRGRATMDISWWTLRRDECLMFTGVGIRILPRAMSQRVMHYCHGRTYWSERKGHVC